jgi:hypothetical protein
MKSTDTAPNLLYTVKGIHQAGATHCLPHFLPLQSTGYIIRSLSSALFGAVDIVDIYISTLILTISTDMLCNKK